VVSENVTNSIGRVYQTGALQKQITVSLDGAAMAQYVPKDAKLVKVGTLKIIGDASGSTLVRSINIERTGSGNATEIEEIR
jgi:hypothetical protein